MGLEISNNTMRARKTALKALCTFIIVEQNKDHEEVNKIGLEHWEEACRKLIFPSGDTYVHGGFNDWTYSQLYHVRFFLIEFAVHCK